MSGMGEYHSLIWVRRGFAILVIAAAAMAFASGPATAQTPAQGPLTAPPPPGASQTTYGFMPLQLNDAPGQIIDEVKTGVLAHDIGFLTHHVEHGVDVNIEMLFAPPDLLSVIGSPRPHIGADINTAGATSDPYAGLTWGISLIQNLFRPGDSVFMTGSLGGAYQDGYIDNAPPNRKRLGSPILFRESAELGYQITPTISVSAILDHISNADLGQHNAGITSAGARLGFKF
jgi:lipid A 3-O-deacylase